MAFIVLYPPLLLLFATQLGLNLMACCWLKARLIKPFHILLLSLIGIYLIAPSIEPESARNCGMSAITIILVGIYGIVVNSIIYGVFRSLALKDIKTPRKSIF